MPKKRIFTVITVTALSACACASSDVVLLKNPAALSFAMGNAIKIALISRFHTEKLPTQPVPYPAITKPQPRCPLAEIQNSNFFTAPRKCLVVGSYQKEGCSDFSGCLTISLHPTLMSAPQALLAIEQAVRAPCSELDKKIAEELSSLRQLTTPPHVSKKLLGCHDGKKPYRVLYIRADTEERKIEL